VRQRRRPRAPKVLASRRTRCAVPPLASCVGGTGLRRTQHQTICVSSQISPLQELLSSLLTFDLVTATGLLILTNSRSDSIGHQYVRVENSVSGIDYVLKRTWRSRLHHSTCANHSNRAQVCFSSRNRLVIPITHHQINVPLLPVCRHSQS
jgi:hypothetical protein